ncbi:hypothetical protein DCC62_11930 [candidate division KSB1 bacterium]|nr:MAG: hypothetical protein DCC62_11930 [candidate division KSB1 bacterium]
MDIAKLAQAWQRSSREDFKVAKSLFDNKHYAYCLFFCHLAVEKALKRIFIFCDSKNFLLSFTILFALPTNPACNWIMR